ncbi:MAG: thioredoxin family protein [Bacteroidetes bacterium]|nr:thioredoxin family protein [Bacteroidota bacterium]
MKYSPILIKYILIVLLVSSCQIKNDSLNVISPDEPIIILPYPPKIGEPITISYNPKHPKAIYKSSQLLFTTLTIFSTTDVSVIRVPLLDKGNGVIASQLIILPKDGVGIDVAISPKDVYMTQEHFNTALANEQLNPPKGGLPFMMRYASHDYQEALSLFNEDKELYPEDYERYALLWNGKIRSGMPKQSILQSIDSVWQYLGNLPNLTAEQVLGVAACGFGYALLNKPNEASTAIHYISNHSSLNTPLRYGTIETLENIIYKSLENLNNSDCQNREDWQRLFEGIANIGLTYSNFKLLSSAFSPSPNFNIKESTTFWTEPLKKVYQIIGRKLINLSNQKDVLKYTANAPGLWLSIGNIMEVLNQWDDATILYEIGNRQLDKLPEWTNNNINSPISVIPLGKIRIDYVLAYKNITAKLNQPHRADSMVAWAWSFPITSFNKVNYSMLATLLARDFIREKDIDSAEKYCSMAINLSTVTPTDLFSGLQNLRLAYGKQKETIAQFKERSKHEVIFSEQIPSMVLQVYESAETKNINIAGIRDTVVYLFFSSKNCSVCRIFIPRIISAFEPTLSSLPYRAIVVTDESIEVTQKEYGANAAYIAFQPEMQMIFGVAAFPVVFKVKNGIIIQRFDGLSENSTNEIISQLK